LVHNGTGTRRPKDRRLGSTRRSPQLIRPLDDRRHHSGLSWGLGGGGGGGGTTGYDSR